MTVKVCFRLDWMNNCLRELTELDLAEFSQLAKSLAVHSTGSPSVQDGENAVRRKRDGGSFFSSIRFTN